MSFLHQLLLLWLWCKLFSAYTWVWLQRQRSPILISWVNARLFPARWTDGSAVAVCVCFPLFPFGNVRFPLLSLTSCAKSAFNCRPRPFWAVITKIISWTCISGIGHSIRWWLCLLIGMHFYLTIVFHRKLGKSKWLDAEEKACSEHGRFNKPAGQWEWSGIRVKLDCFWEWERERAICVFCCNGCSLHGNMVFPQQNSRKIIWSPPLTRLGETGRNLCPVSLNTHSCLSLCVLFKLSSIFVTLTTDQLLEVPAGFDQSHSFCSV